MLSKSIMKVARQVIFFFICNIMILEHIYILYLTSFSCWKLHGQRQDMLNWQCKSYRICLLESVSITVLLYTGDPMAEVIIFIFLLYILWREGECLGKNRVLFVQLFKLFFKNEWSLTASSTSNLNHQSTMQQRSKFLRNLSGINSFKAWHGH